MNWKQSLFGLLTVVVVILFGCSTDTNAPKYCTFDSDCEFSRNSLEYQDICTRSCFNKNVNLPKCVAALTELPENLYTCKCVSNECIIAKCSTNSDCDFLDTEYQDPDRYGFCLDGGCVSSCSKEEYVDACE